MKRRISRCCSTGWSSKVIADMLSISINTVSRHRQEIG
ncbi:MAG: LuxR C-terminal-related transcriptional regulator [Muribaculaceae bacterium]|nr:LuxR C-terminal-related transcriptional regulator [Muribaculaceae bacterium]MDE6486312.1 LuxR C-terminal-related transcriptional regulator [Muribaculaceae bacterium]